VVEERVSIALLHLYAYIQGHKLRFAGAEVE